MWLQKRIRLIVRNKCMLFYRVWISLAHVTNTIHDKSVLCIFCVTQLTKKKHPFMPKSNLELSDRIVYDLNNSARYGTKRGFCTA